MKFVKTEENDSDGFTKNLNGELYEKHKTKFIIDKDEIKNYHKIADRDFYEREKLVQFPEHQKSNLNIEEFEKNGIVSSQQEGC